MKILSVNCGSSSLKYQLFDMSNEEVIAKGMCERIGTDGAVMGYKVPAKGIKEEFSKPMPTHKEAIQLVLDTLMDEKIGVIKNADEIDGVGHRVLHGAEYFKESVVVDEDAKVKMKECIPLGPLHMPANIMGIEACEQVLKGKINVAVFDTSFHQTMPDYAYMYPLPYKDYEELHIRRYGFHGTSHKYVSQVALTELKRFGVEKDTKVVICHLGNGSSISAVKNGECIDTSMGLTPLEGLMMGTRCGDIDSAAALYIMKNRNLSADEMDNYMNKQSGILGIYEKSSDFRDVRDEYYAKSNKRADLVVNMLCYRIKKYIASYAAALGGLDAVCFTGGIGENSNLARALSCQGLEFMGIEIDDERNKVEGDLALISKDSSKVKVFAIPTNEELMIARETVDFVKNK